MAFHKELNGIIWDNELTIQSRISLPFPELLDFYMRKDDILKFDIPMDDISLVHIVHPFHNLSNDYGSCFLGKGRVVRQHIKEMSVTC